MIVMIVSFLIPLAMLILFAGWCAWMETKHLRPPKPKKALPCPHAFCRNMLPRQGAWNFQTGDWAIEDCPMCGGAIQFRSFFAKSHTLHPDDLYLRIHKPEAKS